MENENRVIIVGGGGVIGTVLQKGLKSYKITSLSLPEVDARIYSNLVDNFNDQSTVIHLAINPGKKPLRENSRSNIWDLDNSLMTYNVYKAAIEKKVKRVIMASSVHADNFYQWKGPGELTANRVCTPTTLYGANKIFMESLGRYYATQGLEVICIRFGGINPANEIPKDDFWESAVWLSHEDCTSMIDACLKAKKVPNNFAVFYAVSNNKDRIHDVGNPFGWKPS